MIGLNHPRLTAMLSLPLFKVVAVNAPAQNRSSIPLIFLRNMPLTPEEEYEKDYAKLKLHYESQKKFLMDQVSELSTPIADKITQSLLNKKQMLEEQLRKYSTPSPDSQDYKKLSQELSSVTQSLTDNDNNIQLEIECITNQLTALEANFHERTRELKEEINSMLAVQDDLLQDLTNKPIVMDESTAPPFKTDQTNSSHSLKAAPCAEGSSFRAHLRSEQKQLNAALCESLESTRKKQRPASDDAGPAASVTSEQNFHDLIPKNKRDEQKQLREAINESLQQSQEPSPKRRKKSDPEVGGSAPSDEHATTVTAGGQTFTFYDYYSQAELDAAQLETREKDSYDSD